MDTNQIIGTLILISVFGGWFFIIGKDLGYLEVLKMTIASSFIAALIILGLFLVFGR